MKIYYLLLIYHPKSNIYEIPLKEKKELIIEYINREPALPKGFEFDLDSEEIIEYTDIINKSILTKAQRFLANWQKKLEERDEFLDNTPYTLTNADSLDKIMGNTDRLKSTLEKAIKDLSMEEDLAFGNELESFLEQED